MSQDTEGPGADPLALLAGTGGGTGAGCATWHPVHRGEHGAPAPWGWLPAALVVEAEGQVLGGDEPGVQP